MQKEFEKIFFDNLERRIGIDVRGLMKEGDSNNIKILKNHIETAKKVNTNRTRGGEKGRKGFDFEYLDENTRKNKYLRENKNRKVEVLDNNDQITDIQDGRKKLQLKNVSDINSIDFDKYVEKGARIVVPKDKYQEFQEKLDKKIQNASSPEEKAKYREWKSKLESSEISTFDADHPNLYLAKNAIKDTAIATTEQYTQRMKNLIVAKMIQIFLKKVKEIYNDDSKNYIEAIKEIFIELKDFVKEIWDKELGKSFVDVILQLIKSKLLDWFKKAENIARLFVNNLEEFISLLKDLFLGKLTLKEFLKLSLRTIVYTLLAMVGLVLEEAIAEFISIPVIGEIIAIVLSIGIVSLATVFYSEYFEKAIFGFRTLFEDKELLILRQQNEEIKQLIENKLPLILEQREKNKIEFQEKLTNLENKANNSFEKLKDESLSVEEFEKEFENLGSILGIKL